jgi:hypothetical protein
VTFFLYVWPEYSRINIILLHQLEVGAPIFLAEIGRSRDVTVSAPQGLL